MTVDIATLGIRIDSREALTAAQSLERMRESGARAEQQAASLDVVARKLSQALQLLGVGAGVGAIIRMADEYTKFNAQIKLATQSQREYAAAVDDVRRIANTAQQDLAATGTLYARIANGTRELGVQQKQVAAITETVNLALKVSGATATESASAQLQLSQAFASGTLRGEEFNAVNEAAPRLMKALADGMGVPIGALREMASEGKITSQIMSNVLPGALEQLREEAKQVQTIGGAFTVLKNSVMEFIGTQAQASGSVAVLTGAIGLLADNLNVLAGVALTLTAVKLVNWLVDATQAALAKVAANRALAAANLATAQSDYAAAAAADRVAQARVLELRAAVLAADGNVALAITTNGLIPAEQNAIRTTAALTASYGALTVAQRAASASSAAVSAAVGFLGGPLGAIITVLGVAATAWSWYGSKAEQANKDAASSTEESHEEMVVRLTKQIELLRERAALLQAVPKVQGANQADIDGLARRKAELDAIQNGTGRWAGESASTRQMAEIDAAFRYQQALNLVTTAQKEVKAAAEGTKAQQLAKWYGENGTAAQRLAAELDKLKKQFGEIPPEMEKLVRAKFADKGAAQEQTAYQALVTSINEKIAANNLELSGVNALSEAQKMTIKLDAEIASGKSKLSPESVKRARDMIAELAATEALLKKRDEVTAANKRADEGLEQHTKMVKAHDDQLAKSIQSAQDEATKNEALVATFGMTKGAIEALELARLQDQLAQKSSLGLTLGEIETLEKLIDAKQRNAAAVTRGEELAAAQKGLDDLNQFLDPARAQEFGDALRGAFNGVGDALVKMTKTLDDFGRKSAMIDKQRGNAANAYLIGKIGEQEYLQDIARLNREDTKNRLAGYGDMTAAAAGFFGEQSRGYQALTTASQVFHAAELAMTLADNVQKGIGAVLNQANGDPYSAFGRMAAMAAIVAGLGVAIGGIGSSGGGGQTAAEVQKVQGTGSVFGDSTAKSDSIRRSIEQLTANSDSMLPINQGMLTALKAIESAMTGLTNLVVRTTGLTDGTNMGIQTGQLNAAGAPTDAISGFMSRLTEGLLGPVVGGKLASIGNKLWGSVTQEIIDSGLQYAGSIRDLQAGVGFDQYATINTTKKSWFGLSKKTSTSTQTQDLSVELSNQFALIFANLDKSLQAASIALGGSAADVTKVLDNLTLESTKVSLKGLTGTELTDALNSVISKSMDEIATAVFPQFESFRQVGEGYAETVLRIAGNYAKLDSILSATSTTFGATGIASIAARERLIELAGGIDQLASQSNYFAENFLSKAEQLAPVQKYVTDQLAAMGLQSLDTRDKFKDYVLGLANSGALATEAGAQQYAALLALSEAFAKVHAATEDLTKSEQELKDERKDLQQQYDQLMLTTEQLAAKARAAIDPYNLALYDQIQAQIAVKDAQAALLDAYDKQKSALKSVIDLQLAAAAATEKQINALKLGTLSDLSPEQKYFEAQRQFNAAAPGEAKNAAAQSLLEASRTYNGSTQAYVKDYAKVQAALAVQAASQSSAASIAQQQLDALNKQVAPLIDIKVGISELDVTTKAVADAVKALTSATVAAAAANTAAGASGSGQSVEAMVAGIYKDVLGRQGDASGMAFWVSQIKNGASYSQIYDALKGSDEYKHLHGINAFAKGGIASGWSLVGEEGPELVNFDSPGRVYTADQSRRMMSGGASDAAAAEQTAAIREQNVLIAKQNELLEAIKDATEDTAENGASNDSIRSLKQTTVTALSKLVPA